MHIALLCGGAGKRLWPLSNELRSKLFLELLPSPSGGYESMIGRVIRQLEDAGLLGSVLLVTDQSQTGITSRYTKGLAPVLGEPAKRGTFTAAVLASKFLEASGSAMPDDLLCIAPADMFAGEDFFSCFTRFPELLTTSGADLAMLGTRPTIATDQYGYIIPETLNPQGFASVRRFAEKPDIPTAKQLLEQGALWNSGVYVFRISYMQSQSALAGLPETYEELLQQYETLPVRSFDKQVAEHTQQAVVLPYEGLWGDIGSWETLTNQLDSSVIGQGTISGPSPGSHIVNELPTPIHIIGVPGIIAAASPDGILIADKQQANGIKEQLGEQPRQPMHMETAWGLSRVIERTHAQENSYAMILNTIILPGKHTGLRGQQSGMRAWTVLAGSGQTLINGNLTSVSAGDQFVVRSSGSYALYAENQLELLEVQIGSEDEGEPPVQAENCEWNELVKLAGDTSESGD